MDGTDTKREALIREIARLRKRLGSGQPTEVLEGRKMQGLQHPLTTGSLMPRVPELLARLLPESWRW